MFVDSTDLCLWILHYNNFTFEENINSEYGFDCKEQCSLLESVFKLLKLLYCQATNSNLNKKTF